MRQRNEGIKAACGISCRPEKRNTKMRNRTKQPARPRLSNKAQCSKQPYSRWNGRRLWNSRLWNTFGASSRDGVELNTSIPTTTNIGPDTTHLDVSTRRTIHERVHKHYGDKHDPFTEVDPQQLALINATEIPQGRKTETILHIILHDNCESENGQATGQHNYQCCRISYMTISPQE